MSDNESEKFTFIVLTTEGHSVEERYFNRHYADKHFDKLVNEAQGPKAVCVAYYCASVGGCVNAQHFV